MNWHLYAWPEVQGVASPDRSKKNKLRGSRFSGGPQHEACTGENKKGGTCSIFISSSDLSFRFSNWKMNQTKAKVQELVTQH